MPCLVHNNTTQQSINYPVLHTGPKPRFLSLFARHCSNATTWFHITNSTHDKETSNHIRKVDLLCMSWTPVQPLHGRNHFEHGQSDLAFWIQKMSIREGGGSSQMNQGTKLDLTLSENNRARKNLMADMLVENGDKR